MVNCVSSDSTQAILVVVVVVVVVFCLFPLFSATLLNPSAKGQGKLVRYIEGSLY